MELTPKEMRQELKEAGITVPVSNKDVITAHEEFKSTPVEEGELLEAAVEAPKEQPPEPPSVIEHAYPVTENTYTYNGTGANPPSLIKFMGVQVFHRGKPTEVTDEQVLRKIRQNPSFVKGVGMTPDEMYDADLAESQKEDQQNLINSERNSEVQKAYKK